MGKVRTKSNTYSQLENFTYFPWSFDYTKEEKEKITSFFPKKHKDSAFKETLEHATVLISCLMSDIAPENVKRSVEKKELEKLYESLRYLGVALNRTKSGDPTIVKLKRAYYELTKLNFNDLINGIQSTKTACEYLLKNPGRPGTENPHFSKAIGELAKVWRRYTGKEPTRQNKKYEAPNGQFSQKASGLFLEYLEIAIQSLIDRLNKENKKYNQELKRKKELKDRKFRKEIPSPSLPNIARDVIRKRKRMAEIPPKEL